MKNAHFGSYGVLLLVLLTHHLSSFAVEGDLAGSTHKTKKVVFILVDGIPKDVIEKLHTPNLDAISLRGGFYSAHVGGMKGGYSQTPTISAVGYNSMLTGTWVNKHNVSSNSIKAPNYHYWTVFRMAKEYDENLSTAVFSSWTDNRTKLVGDGLAQTAYQKIDYAFDGLDLDKERYPEEDKHYQIFRIDEAVSEEAAKVISNSAPDLSWVYLWYPDDAAHMLGDSDYFYKHVELADKQIGRIWAAVEDRRLKHNEDWMIVVTTDHGRTAVNGKGHGGHSIRERATWIASNVRANEYGQHNPGITSIASTVVRFLEIDVAQEVENEMDGVSFYGDISIAKAVIERVDDLFTVSWRAFGDGEVQIFISASNHFATGGKDDYQLVGQTSLAAELYSFPVPVMESDRYKILLKSKNNTVNVWWQESAQ